MEKTRIDYLRLSVTDRCNLNCLYCTPLEKAQFLTHDEVLRHEEMARLVTVFSRLGVKKVRVTGGEPLIKKNITGLLRLLKEIKGIEEISMTTNGVHLKDMARELKEAGLDIVNISLDTLKKERYRRLTGKDSFEDVRSAIHKAIEVGLSPVKLNVVAMKGVNDDEVLDFAELTLRYPLSIRFIEFFPTSKRSNELAYRLIRNTEIKERIIHSFGELQPVSGIIGNGPAEYYALKDSKGALGFISSFSSNFCYDCNRIRVDCAGRISPCLFSGYIYDARERLRSERGEDGLIAAIKGVFEAKSRYNKKTTTDYKIEMSSIGG